MRVMIAEMQKTASQPIVAGSLDIALFGEDVAREGILQILDVFLRDPSVGSRVQMAVVDGKAIDIFKGKYGDRGNAAYLSQLIEHNMAGEKEIDPVGFGHIAKTKTRKFDFNKWKADYKNAQFKVNADVKIVEVGVVE